MVYEDSVTIANGGISARNRNVACSTASTAFHIFSVARMFCNRNRSGLAALFLGLLISGCATESSTPIELDLPLVEPAKADTANADAVRQFQQEIADGDLVSSQDPAEWPQLFGPDRTCVAAHQSVNLAWGKAGPQELWSIEIGSGYGSPVASGNRVLFNHRIKDEEIIQCVDIADGSTHWEHRYPTTFECDVEYSSGPYSTPVIAGGRVYAVGGQGQFFCLDLQTGEVVWQRLLHEEHQREDDLFPVGASPSVVNDQVVFNLGAADEEASIVAMSAETGEDIWQTGDHPAGYCSPWVARIHDQDFLFVITNRGLVCLNPETGEMDWFVKHFSRAPMSYNAVSPLVKDDMVLIVTGPGPGAVCLQIQPDRSYKELWKNRRVIDCQYNTLILHGDSVVAFTAAGQGGAELRCVDFATGKLQWRYHSVLRRGQGLSVGGALILLGERGHLAALLPGENEPQVLAFTEEPLMTAPCYCAPAISNSKLLLKDETRLACFDLSIKNQ